MSAVDCQTEDMMTKRTKRRGTKGRTPDDPGPPATAGPTGPLAPGDRLIKRDEVLELACHGKSWLYDKIERGLFPPGYIIGRNRFWLLSEVIAALNRLLRP
jgi:predicted DNA-binding transcriptional regulator AlpA